MVDLGAHGRPIPALLYRLGGSFVLMLLSGIFYGLGLPEDWARALFIATVIVWIVLAVVLMIQGIQETGAYEPQGHGGSDGDSDGGSDGVP